MSAPVRCPRVEELIDLIGPPAAEGAGPAVLAELRRHAEACSDCQAELGLLREGFFALNPGPGPVDELALRRIEARVMPAVLADLGPMDNPVAAAAPRPLLAAPSFGRMATLGALCALAVVPAGFLWMKLGDSLLQPGRALAVVLLPILLLPAVLLPARLRGGALLFGALVMVASALSSVEGVDLPLLRGAGCVLLGVSGWVLPAAVLLLTPRFADGGPAERILAGALRGATVGAGGLCLQRALCGIGGMAHTLLFHLLPLFFLMAACALIIPGALPRLKESSPRP